MEKLTDRVLQLVLSPRGRGPTRFRENAAGYPNKKRDAKFYDRIMVRFNPDVKVNPSKLLAFETSS